MITVGNIIVTHAVGDYLLQSDWMANEKTKRWLPAAVHAFTYTLPFLCLTQSWKALLFIGLTHMVIDHYRLARYVCWLKNFLSPRKTVVFIPDPKGEWHEQGHFCPDMPKLGGGVTYICPRGTQHMARREETVWWHPWAECVGTGYHKDRPAWMAVWLMIFADNTLHILLNGLAIRFWG